MVSEIYTRTPKDLEWFRPPERNTLRPLFLYCSSKILDVQSFRKLEDVCIASACGCARKPCSGSFTR
jgi:hypothetical protein